MKTALVTAIGSFSADIVIKSLKKQGLRVIGCDIFPKEWVADAYSVDLFYQVPRGTNRERYLHALQDICMSNQVDFVLPLTDVEVDTLNENREWFDEHSVKLCMSSKDTIDVCRNKLLTFQRLKHCEFGPVLIPTLHGKEYETVEDTWFPVICKPYNGRSSQGIKRFLDKKKLQSFFASVVPEDYIIQPVMSGAVITVDIVRSANGETIISVPRKELLRTLSGAGTSVRVFRDEKLSQICALIAEALGVVGCVNFEFIQSEDGSFHFLECNPRFSGGLEFSCMIGYDFVQNHLNCFLNEAIDPLPSYQPCYIARKYEEVITSIG